LVFAVSGTGRVSQGVIEILELLPHRKVEPSKLKKYFQDFEKEP
jgi:hypothetical protein